MDFLFLIIITCRPGPFNNQKQGNEPCQKRIQAKQRSLASADEETKRWWQVQGLPPEDENIECQAAK